MSVRGTVASVCSVALSGQAPKPRSGASKTQGLTARSAGLRPGQVSRVDREVPPANLVLIDVEDDDQIFSRNQPCRIEDERGHGIAVVYGDVQDNILTGGAGNDYLDEVAGNDTLIGGPGNDYYVIHSLGDVATENPGEGADAELFLVSGGTLARNVEVGIVGLTTGATLTGNASANTLVGGSGNDTLDGGPGDDALIGDPLGSLLRGNDTFVFHAGSGNDFIADFEPGTGLPGDTRHDLLDLRDYRRFVDVLAGVNARLGADANRYFFIVMDLHHVLLAGLPAHFESDQPGILNSPATMLFGLPL